MSATVAATSKWSLLPARMGLLRVSLEPHLSVLLLCVSDEPVWRLSGLGPLGVGHGRFVSVGRGATGCSISGGFPHLAV